MPLFVDGSGRGETISLMTRAAGNIQQLLVIEGGRTSSSSSGIFIAIVIIIIMTFSTVVFYEDRKRDRRGMILYFIDDAPGVNTQQLFVIEGGRT